jgi:hypothetical protein
MNKKADTKIFGVIFGLIVAVIFIIILLSLIKGFFLDQNKGEKDLDTFYFSHFAKDLKNLKIDDKKESSIVLTKEKILISFNKEDFPIKKEDIKCTNFNLKNEINKPIKCRGKSCLCLCELKDENPLEVNCDDEDLICVPFDVNIKTDNSCNNFILYTKDEKVQNLAIKRDKEDIYVEISKNP